LIKYFIPGFLFVLLSDQLRKEQFNPFMGLGVGSGYQLEGMLPFIFMLLVVFGVIAFPELMAQSYDEKREKEQCNTEDIVRRITGRGCEL